MKNLMTMTGIRPDNAKSQQLTKQKKNKRVKGLKRYLLDCLVLKDKATRC